MPQLVSDHAHGHAGLGQQGGHGPAKCMGIAQAKPAQSRTSRPRLPRLLSPGGTLSGPYLRSRSAARAPEGNRGRTRRLLRAGGRDCPIMATKFTPIALSRLGRL